MTLSAFQGRHRRVNNFMGDLFCFVCRDFDSLHGLSDGQSSKREIELHTQALKSVHDREPIFLSTQTNDYRKLFETLVHHLLTE